MPKNKFATPDEAKAMGDLACKLIRKDRLMGGYPVDYKVYPTVKGALLFMTIGSLKEKILPDTKTLRHAMGKVKAAGKKLGLGKVACCAMPPIIRIHMLTSLYEKAGAAIDVGIDKKAVFNITVGDTEYCIFPRIEDLRRMGTLMKECLKGHGPSAWIIDANGTLSSSAAKRIVTGKAK